MKQFNAVVRRDTSTDWYDTPLAAIRALIGQLSDDERVEVADLFGEYCRHCGTNDPRCQCWNDE